MNIPLGSLDLAHLKRLQTLDVSFEEVMVLNQDPLSLYLPIDMLTLLRRTSAPTSIEILRMTLAWECITPNVENPIFSQLEWDILDGLLAGPDYPALWLLYSILDLMKTWSLFRSSAQPRPYRQGCLPSFHDFAAERV